MITFIVIRYGQEVYQTSDWLTAHRMKSLYKDAEIIREFDSVEFYNSRTRFYSLEGMAAHYSIRLEDAERIQRSGRDIVNRTMRANTKREYLIKTTF